MWWCILRVYLLNTERFYPVAASPPVFQGFLLARLNKLKQNDLFPTVHPVTVTVCRLRVVKEPTLNNRHSPC
jgi:hypothetical protein